MQGDNELSAHEFCVRVFCACNCPFLHIDLQNDFFIQIAGAAATVAPRHREHRWSERRRSGCLRGAECDPCKSTFRTDGRRLPRELSLEHRPGAHFSLSPKFGTDLSKVTFVLTRADRVHETVWHWCSRNVHGHQCRPRSRLQLRTRRGRQRRRLRTLLAHLCVRCARTDEPILKPFCECCSPWIVVFSQGLSAHKWHLPPIQTIWPRLAVEVPMKAFASWRKNSPLTA